MTKGKLLLIQLAMVIAPSVSSAQQASGGAPAPRPSAAECATLGDAKVDHGSMDHSTHQALLDACAPKPVAVSLQSGQSAYAAIADIVRVLEADPGTDWSKVNLEALRQHLIDMDDVTLRSVVTQVNVAGGIRMDITGTGHTIAAIQRMVGNHAKALDRSATFSATAEATPAGMRLVVVAKDPADARMVARIRGLGFAGLLTEGDHHASHHLAVARGNIMAHGR